MDTSAITGSANGDTLQAAVQMSLLKKTQDMQAQEVSTLLQSATSVSPNKGRNFDAMA